MPDREEGSTAHGLVCTAMQEWLQRLLRETQYQVLGPQIPVRLLGGPDDPPERAQIVICPDLLVVSEAEQREDGICCRGAPDLLIEIIAENETVKDLSQKFLLYQEVGVQEYWKVDPVWQLISVFRRDGNRFGRIFWLYQRGDYIPVPGTDYIVAVSDFFPGMEPAEIDCAAGGERREGFQKI